MLSIQLFQLIVDEREREIQAELRARRLLRQDSDGASAGTNGAHASYRDSWRARTPRANATTR
jgi:hypothetical protein